MNSSDYRIDAELNRLQHKQDIEEQLKAKLEKTKQELQILPENYEYNEDFEDSSDLIIKRKDKKMAKDDPQRYCADRCVSTGHCDVFEDLYSMSAMEVRAFCTDCVLSEEEEVSDLDVTDKYISHVYMMSTYFMSSWLTLNFLLFVKGM